MRKLIVLFIMLFNVKVLASDELVMATEAGFAPYEYYSQGKIVGVDVDIANEIAKRLNKKLVIKDVAFDSIISEIKTKKSDMGIAGISYTKEREKEVDFTINYSESRQVIIVRKDSDLKSKEELKGKVAVQLGSVADTIISEDYPNLELVREKKFLAAIEDLKSRKVDAVVMDELPAKKLLTKDLKIVTDPLAIDNYAIIVNKDNKELREEINSIINSLKEEGKIERFILKHLNYEETETVTFKDKLYKTLIHNQRYKYILEGLKNTVLIAVGAVIIGIILGSLIAIVNNYYENTGKLRILNFLGRLYVNIIRGTPSTLQLMIIYYVIFKSVDINMIIVGISAFGINSSAYVAEIIRAGLNSVDKGEIEAGYSLSLGYGKVMKNIVFPQAIRNILPALGNEFITLVKETSIGAYIGIVELTKSSDIIASRTYDYFFPLMIIALIYLAITMTLNKGVRKMEKRLSNARSS